MNLHAYTHCLYSSRFRLVDNHSNGLDELSTHSSILAFLWRFRASPQGLKGHTNEMKPLVTRIGDDPIPSGSKPDILPTQTHGYHRGDFPFPSVYYYTTSYCICQYLSDIFLSFNHLSTLQAHTSCRFPLRRDTEYSHPRYSVLD